MWLRNKRNRIPSSRMPRWRADNDYANSTLPRIFTISDPQAACGPAHRSGEGIMHRLMAGYTILEHELSELRLLVERQIGILLDCPNSALAAHVADYLESQELESAGALLA